MYQVLIVEDEMLVRLGLRNSVNWGAYHMSVCADVSDGKTALNIFRSLHPDIVITDLRMPIMDGMELIRQVRKDSKQTRIVILTCLEEFGLVRKAISLGVSDYIPKLSMTTKDIETILCKLEKELDVFQKKQTDTVPGVTENEAAKEHMLKGYLFYNMYSDTELDSFLQKHQMHLSPEDLQLCILEIDHFPKLQTRYRDLKGGLIKISILNVLNELMHTSHAGEVFFDDDRHYVLLLNPYRLSGTSSVSARIEKFLADIRGILRMYFDLSVTFGISSMGHSYQSLKELYPEASTSLKNKFWGGGGKIYLAGTIVPSRVPQEAVLHALDAPEVKGLIDVEKTTQQVKKFFSAPSYSENSVKAVLRSLAGQIRYRVGLSMPTGFNTTGTEFERTAAESETLEELCAALCKYAQTAESILAGQRDCSKEITLAVQYLNHHFNRDVTLGELAAHVGLSTNYLSNLFKKEVGQNFVEYLSKIRMETAKRLLTESSLKIYEIAQQVGFTEEGYFSKVFKKTVGLSPNEYRSAAPRGEQNHD